MRQLKEHKRRMFPQYPDSRYREPTLWEKVRDALVLSGCALVVVLGLWAVFNLGT